MRQKLGKGMIVAGAATSIMSLCAIPAFADSNAQEATGDMFGALTSSAPGLTDDGASEDGSRLLRNDAGPSGDQNTVADYGDDDAGGGAVGRTAHTPQQDGTPQGVGADVVREVGHHVDDVRGAVGRVGEAVAEHLVGGAFPGHGEWPEEEGGYGDDGDMGEPPVSEPPAAPPVTPPATTPADPAPQEAPPAARPHGEPPALAQTGAGDEMLMVSGAAAALLVGGVLVYRRGRVASRG
ncbi:LPXTG cell wall anchor domain-containing protein [Streptomyces sp. DH20]|uniref:LPXTG cell wall anchor domain-containing protein n=1 Tax=Streptomyces sp. DH20 TaxID=2857009 RepID=UPI001E59B277|nr:LPXTG cell wall anchor domain-containing protein [Streptomyces sp. DH20]